MKQNIGKILCLLGLILVLSLAVVGCKKNPQGGGNTNTTEYTVTFDTDGVANIASAKVKSGEALRKPDGIPTKTGYDFVCWTLDGEPYDFSKAVTGDMTLVARYKAIEYTITYQLFDGSFTVDNAPTTYTIETEDFTLPRPVKANMEFLGWTEVTGGAPVLDLVIPKGSVGNRTFVAHFDSIKYEVSFDTNGAGELASAFVKHGDTLKAPTLERAGYSLVGWYLGDELWDFANGTVTENLSLRAEWALITYTIKYKLDGGTIENAPTEYTVLTETFTIPAPQKEGSQFRGWTWGTMMTPVKELTIEQGSTGNYTLMANWFVNSYVVKLDANGAANNPFSAFAEHGSRLKEPVVIRKGYTLIGWFNGDKPWDFERDTVSQAMTLVAKWEPISYTIDYDLGGGKIKDAPSSYTIDTETFSIPIPEKEGCTFLGWTYKGQTTPVYRLTIEKGSEVSYKLVANWSVDTYQVKLDANGGESI